MWGGGSVMKIQIIDDEPTWRVFVTETLT